MKKIYTLLFTILSTASILSAQQAEIFSTNGKAIKGYDVVAFFTEGKPTAGFDSLQYQWKETKWLFSTTKNLKQFIENPDKYVPQYGGYCAYGTAGNHKSSTQVDTWTILNDKLYFNYNLKVKEYWNKKQDSLIQKADINWQTLKKL